MPIVETPTTAASWLREMWERANPAASVDDFERIALQHALEHARADAAALWVLAEMNTPPDIIEFGERHKMPELAKHLWQSAFVAGWRAHHKASAGRQPDGAPPHE